MKVCKKCGTQYVLCNFGVPHEVQLCDCEDPQEEKKVQDDPRFPEWKPDEKTQKTTVLYHMSYAHEDQAKKEGIEWWGSNIQYWLRKFTRKQLLEIHQKYHNGGS
uniref:Uncharacterized protein n=1 Tax=viral metagenome TaxID=1070528 RepID=A0A6M3X6G3_9ZZZZ